MKIQLRAEGFELLEGTRIGLSDKLKDLENIFPKDTLFNVVLKRRSNGYKCEIRVQNGRDFIRGEATESVIEYSISSAVKVIRKRARKLKQMYIDKEKKTFISIKDIVEEVITEAKKDWGIERVKELDLPFINEFDALIELEQLDHSFYIFKNIEKSGKTCVMYRRNEGYGLIVTS